MRILHLCSSLAPGGAERQLCYLSRSLAHRGHQVDIGLANTGPNISLLAGDKNVRLHVIGQGKRVLADAVSLRNYNPFLLPRVFALLREVRPDVVQTWIPQMDIIGGMIAIAGRVPWIIREANSALLYASGPTKAKMRAWLGRNASTVVANSHAGSDYWRAASPSVRRVVIRNGIPLDKLERVPRLNHPDLCNGVPLVLWAGRFDVQKNVERTFQALADAVSHTSARVLLCGAGPLKQRLEQMLAALPQPSCVELWPYQSELWPLMKRADIFVSASLYEGSPNVVMEAMACRCPLVVSDIPEHRELLSPESAEFVDPHSVASISAGIQRALANPACARARAEKAYGEVRQFSVEQMASNYEVLYRSVLSAVS